MTPNLPIKHLAIFGFLLNMLWEFAQCPFLYDMSNWGFWKTTAYMWGAIVGDIFIVLGVVGISWRLRGQSTPALFSPLGWISTFSVGFIAAVLLEWLARILNLWNYSTLMPTITVAGEAVGLAPVIQMTILPALSLYFGAVYQERRDASRS